MKRNTSTRYYNNFKFNIRWKNGGIKAQSAVEFLILLGLMLFIFLAYTQLFQKSLGEKSKEQRILIIQDLALSIQNEIDLASSSTSGYERSFEVPEKILNLEYDVSLVDNSVYIITNDGKIATSLPIQNVTGDIQKGLNTIKKNETGIYINA